MLFWHVVKRLLLMLAGYLVATLATLIAIVALYLLLSSFPGAPAYFAMVGMSPLWMLFIPPVGAVVYMVSLICGATQAFVLALFSEFFQLRHPLIHAVFGAVTAATAFMMVSPVAVDLLDHASMPDLGIIGAAGLAGGLVYWAIAGRGAGFSPQRPAP